jgi:uncharacterized RmlC-like cupin family protein
MRSAAAHQHQFVASHQQKLAFSWTLGHLRTMQTDSASEVETFLGGAVRKVSLPVFTNSPAPGAPAVKRLLLPQGELAQILDEGVPIQYLAFMELRAGSIRGNHVHKVKQEFVYIARGEALLALQDTVSKVRESISLRAGDLVFIPAGIAHALQVTQDGCGVEYAQARFDPSDTERWVVVDADDAKKPGHG